MLTCMLTLIQRFLEQIRILKSKKLTYRQPGDGSDGTCDCIGLIIGALKRMGIKWNGIHGSNYSARNRTINLQRIQSASQLEVGDIVYKAYNPGEAKYNLPDRYKPGKQYYNGDLRDYYHVGVVTSISPLNITHMTSPTMKVDTSLSKWGYFGKCSLLTEDSKPAPVNPIPAPGQDAKEGAKAIVTAPSGRYVKMRQQPSTRCGVYDEIPVGAAVTLIEPGEEWAKISYGRRTGWYMMAKYLKVQ